MAGSENGNNFLEEALQKFLDTYGTDALVFALCRTLMYVHSESLKEYPENPDLGIAGELTPGSGEWFEVTVARIDPPE